MAKQTRSTRGRKAKVKTMKRRKAKVNAKAKTMKKQQRRTRLGLMKRKRITRKVKRGGGWAWLEAKIKKEREETIKALLLKEKQEKAWQEWQKNFPPLDGDVAELNCNTENDDCIELIEAVKKFIEVYYPNTYIFFDIQKNNIDSAIKKSIIVYKKNNKKIFKMEGIISRLIFHFILTGFIKFVKDVLDDFYDTDKINSDALNKKITELKQLKHDIRTHERNNMLLVEYDKNNPGPEVEDAKIKKLITELTEANRNLMNKIISIQIPESLRQYILTDEEKQPAQENSAQVEENPAPVYDMAAANESIGYKSFGDDKDVGYEYLEGEEE